MRDPLVILDEVADLTPVTPEHEVVTEDIKRERLERFFSKFDRGPRKGHTKWRRARLNLPNHRGRRPHRGYREPCMSSMRQMDGATRRRQQDALDAERQIQQLIDAGQIPNPTKSEYVGMVQQASRVLTAQRGGW